MTDIETLKSKVTNYCLQLQMTNDIWTDVPVFSLE